jgi:beta-lactam-binding protein with PASTA domain
MKRTVSIVCSAGALLLTLGLGTSCRDDANVAEQVEQAADEAAAEMEEAGEEVADEIDDHTDAR